MGLSIQSTIGNTVDFLLCARRDKSAALAFFRKAFRENNLPEKVVIDKGSVASINCGTRRSLNWDYGSYRAISIAKFSKVETLSLAPIICLF